MTKEALTLILTAVFGAGGLVGVLGQIILARYSKSKRERDVDIANKYLSLTSASVDEVEKRINLIGKLDGDNRKLQNEMWLLQEKQAETEAKRKERDEQIESMEARMAALQAQIDKDARERNELRAKLAEFDLKNRVLWQYCVALIEQLKLNRIVPVNPPSELKSDPEIVKLLSDINNKEAK